MADIPFGMLNSGIIAFLTGSFPKNSHVTKEYIVKNSKTKGPVMKKGFIVNNIFILSKKVGFILSVFKFKRKVSPVSRENSSVDLIIIFPLSSCIS